MSIDINGFLVKLLVSLPAIMIGFTFHEFAHAIVADKLGDKTPRFQGRLTLNPIAHIDPLGLIAIIIVGLGWAKPVETNPKAYKNFYRDDLKVSLAGPVANLMIVIIFSVIRQILYINGFESRAMVNPTMFVILEIIIQIISINSLLFFFNLMPLPGLDGFHILRDFFPKAVYKISGNIYRYQFFILAVFIIFLAPYLVVIPSEALVNSLFKILNIF